MKRISYASTVGSIRYAMTCTRPDVAYAISITSSYQANLGEKHWAAVKNILTDLRRTKDMFMVYGGVEEELTVRCYTGRCYTGAGFNTDRGNLRSQSRYVFTLNRRAISWKSSKQEVVALSTTESEYIVACEAAQEVDSVRKFISDLGVVPSIKSSIKILCDNIGSTAIAREPMVTKKTRHIQ
ncbi:secreted RxLR effector protein 161-like [Lactuca sativa]|uniref:secreted RxLR effector protein 161-like n=1 Tax=Lactuca sativa TaxID=4236 RepID=UPI001C69239D|nr:secreted RxLR effector protein 161-like [Lactuca sativa]